MLSVQHDSSSVTLSRTHSYLGTSAMSKLDLQGANRNTLKGQHARLGTLARRTALVKQVAPGRQGKPIVRTARMGPGWVVGTSELASGLPPLGAFKAITSVKLHHLPYSTIQRMEDKNPRLIMQLYKLLAHMMARNENNTIAQLTVMRNILSSPAHSKPIPRSAAMRSIGR